jgi:hypothetical protein
MIFRGHFIFHMLFFVIANAMPHHAIMNSIISENTLSQIHLPHTPNLPLIFHLIIREAQASLATFSFPAFPGLITQPQHNPLKVILHAAFRARWQVCARTGHIFIEYFAFFVYDAEERHKGCFGGQLDGNDRVADTGKNLGCEEWEVRFYEVHVKPACGSDHYKRKSAFIDGIAGLDRCREGFEDGLGSFEALACWC